MKKAEEYCEICHKYGHKRSRCPTHRDRRREHHGAVAMAGYNEQPVLANWPMHMGMPMMAQWPVFQGQYPHPHMHPQFYPSMYVEEEPPDLMLESTTPVPVEVDENFWAAMNVRNFQETIESVYEDYRNFMFGNMMQGGLVDKLPLTTSLCKRQNLENPQSNYDMGMCFIAVGRVSRILQHKCKVMLKGKTGLYLCGDIYSVLGDLEHHTTDDIDLVILARHAGQGDVTRKVFAQQVGAFIKSCLDFKRAKSIESAERAPDKTREVVKRGCERLTYSCVDVVMRGPGVCGTDLESKNVKVVLGDTEEPRKKVKLIDITYSTYDEEIDKLYSRVRAYTIRGGLTFFYLDVHIALMEYVYIIYKNVRQCREFVAKGGVRAIVGDTREGVMSGKVLKRVHELTKKKELMAKKRGDKAGEAEEAEVDVRGVDCASARCFLDNLTEFEQKTMFKFSKSAFLCASIIVDLPDHDSSRLSLVQKQHLQKRIVLMQVRELASYGIIPKKFSSVMSQTYDVLSEMLDDVILQQNERERYHAAQMHEHLAERLLALEHPPKERMQTRFTGPIADFSVEKLPFFELPQMIPQELVSPASTRSSVSLTSNGELSVPEDERHSLWRQKHKAYKKLTKKQRRARKKFLKNRSLQLRQQSPESGASASQGLYRESEKLHDLTSSSSGTVGFYTPRSSLSDRGDSPRHDEPAEGGKSKKHYKTRSKSIRIKTRKNIKKRSVKNKKYL